MRKGQSELMEYMLMLVFIVAAVIGIIIFLTWWNVTQFQMQGSKNRQDRVLSIGQDMMADYTLSDGESVFDDSKLTSLLALGPVDSCKGIEAIYGTSWYVKIKALDMGGETKCDWTTYPNCNVWEICSPKAHPESVSAQSFPVNVYRKVSGKVALAVLRVEAYT